MAINYKPTFRTVEIPIFGLLFPQAAEYVLVHPVLANLRKQHTVRTRAIPG